MAFPDDVASQVSGSAAEPTSGDNPTAVGPTTGDATPAARPGGRFTRGLVIDVARVIESYGYDELTARSYARLQSHLFHFLLRAEQGDEQCHGGTMEAPEVSALVDIQARLDEHKAGNRRLAAAIGCDDERWGGLHR
jgi:hypothetical protein